MVSRFPGYTCSSQLARGRQLTLTNSKALLDQASLVRLVEAREPVVRIIGGLQPARGCLPVFLQVLDAGQGMAKVFTRGRPARLPDNEGLVVADGPARVPDR